ncbi:xap-5-like protein [Schizosaccharomyces cryophilus OY26]|uniref:Xap-5-like protein n=1 Tax=Schizosaccharomyces cryophilus (strain OY26 / ATCC MYA-4695 / CBS 11777 / NBRC 106824 / NRRL Y48691) TaxID=653667 RepID=S9WYT7_SCHCR|nr:xap-5-like protein [Schizosaccharomyces cryophilus OY26]EPY49842.1 xap-5-like protein [Schizosaccharomyces cryophilus OY26]
MSGYENADELLDLLRKQTTGLVHLEDYRRVKQGIAEKKEKDALSQTNQKIKKKKGVLSKNVKKQLQLNKGKLSFGQEETEEETDDRIQEITLKKKHIGKDPTANTSFLPDAEREALEEARKEEYRKQWLEEQERIKEEEILIPFLYYDGTTTRYSVRIRLKDSVGHILSNMKDQIPGLKRVLDMDKFLLVQSDLIIPHHHELYYFYLNKVQGPNGALFDFDALRCQNSEVAATLQLPERKIPHLVLKSFYMEYRHVFPCNCWEMFDSRKNYSQQRNEVNPNAALFYRTG